MSIDLLSKLNPRSVSWLPSGGTAKYDLDDVIGAIAHLPPLATVYIYAINETVSNDRKIKTNMAKLQVHFASKLYGIILKDNFKTRKVSQIGLADGIARAAIYAHFFARGQCKSCNGTGMVYTQGAKVCPDCFGKGVRMINNVEKTKIAFPEVGFNRSWWCEYAQPYDEMVQNELVDLLVLVEDALGRVRDKNNF